MNNNEHDDFFIDDAVCRSGMDLRANASATMRTQMDSNPGALI